MAGNNIGSKVVNTEHDAQSNVNNTTTAAEGLGDNLDNPALEGLEEVAETTEDIAEVFE